MRWGAAVAAAVLVGVGCERPRTELVVRVDSELDWGAGRAVQSVALTVRRGGPTGALRDARSTALGTGRGALPLFVGVVAADDDVEAPVWVEALGCAEADGCTAATARVAQRAVVRFARGETREVPLLLASACEGVTCASDERCATNGRCEPATAAQVLVRPFAGFVTATADAAGPAMDAADAADPVDADTVMDAGRVDDGTPDAGAFIEEAAALEDSAIDAGTQDAGPPGDDVDTIDVPDDDGFVAARDATADVPADLGIDAGPMTVDAIVTADSGPIDAGPSDTGPTDTGPTDAGPRDVPPCTPSTESFNSRDDDCDGLVDEGFSSNGVSLACTGEGRTALLPDRDIDEGGFSSAGDGLEIYCINGSQRFCLTGEACPWRAGPPATDNGMSCSTAGLRGPSYFMAYYISGYFVVASARFDEWYCPPSGRVRLALR